MPSVSPDILTAFIVDILHKAGLPVTQAARTTEHLVEANLMGHDSHGVLRVPGYATQLQSGQIQPLGQQVIERESPSVAVLDANRSIGILMAYDAMERAVDKCERYGLGAVTVHSASHIGRLGAFPPLAAARNCIGIIMLNGGAMFTAPFGGTDRRLPPNPIAISVPTASGNPMMLDITTSLVAGGKLEVLAARRQPAPEGWLVDEEGNSVTDPAALRTPHAAMLPLGGDLGHKGYGLGMMIDVMAGTLSRAGCSRATPTRGASGFLCLALHIEHFVDLDEYFEEVRHLTEWVKSSRTMPGVDEVLLPGEIERQRSAQRRAEGIPIEETTWRRLTETAQELNATVPVNLTSEE